MPRGRPRKVVEIGVVGSNDTLVTIEATVAADLHLGDGRVIHGGDNAEVPGHVADDLVKQSKAKLA